ncbi:MAG: (Fe-S)-binding protein [Candidatus Binatia bacterium]
MSGPGLPCVHCGLCLDTCPTYRVLGTEADSPRGRIYIMEAIGRGELELDDDAALHLSRCLGCLACETACPSGVSFGRRLEEFRPRLAERRDVSGTWSSATKRAYNSPGLVDAGLRVAGLMDRAGLGGVRRQIPGLGLLPAEPGEAGSPDADVSPLRRSSLHQPLRPRARAAVLTGCVGDRLLPGINRDTVEVLQRNGIEVVDVRGQVCCGALDLHAGREAEAEAFAVANAAAFGAADVDFVVTTAAGCGAVVRDYAHLLRGGDHEEAGREVAGSSRDICELLVEIGFEKPARTLEVAGEVAYHDACHLLHARGIADAPRRIVEAAFGRPPVDLGENAICCGSAGSYNLDHPRISAELGARKAELARERSAAVVAVGNVGCMMQISRAVALAGMKVDVRHPVQLLAAAYRLSDEAAPT